MFHYLLRKEVLTSYNFGIKKFNKILNLSIIDNDDRYNEMYLNLSTKYLKAGENKIRLSK